MMTVVTQSLFGIILHISRTIHCSRNCPFLLFSCVSQFQLLLLRTYTQFAMLIVLTQFKSILHVFRIFEVLFVVAKVISAQDSNPHLPYD